jgi:hypothetical protein
MFARGKASITLRTSAGHILPLPTPQPSEGVNREYLERVVRALEGIRDLFNLVGSLPPKLTLSEVERQVDEIVSVADVFSGRPESLSFDTELPQEGQDARPFKMAYVGYLEFSGVYLAYYSLAEMVPQAQDGYLHWNSQTFTGKEVKLLTEFPREYPRFTEEAKSSLGTPHAMVKPATPGQQA